jgi:hypothetical protein
MVKSKIGLHREHLEKYLLSDKVDFLLRKLYFRNRELYLIYAEDTSSHEFQMSAGIDMLFWDYFLVQHSHLFENDE